MGEKSQAHKDWEARVKRDEKEEEERLVAARKLADEDARANEKSLKEREAAEAK